MRRRIRREDKKLMTKMLVDTEAEAVLSTRQSLNQRNKRRKLQFFEDKDEAEKRSKLREELEKSGLRVPKKHSPDPNPMEFDKEGLAAEVTAMSDGDTVST